MATRNEIVSLSTLSREIRLSRVTLTAYIHGRILPVLPAFKRLDADNRERWYVRRDDFEAWKIARRKRNETQ